MKNDMPVPFVDHEEEKIASMARYKEIIAVSQIARAKMTGEDASKFTTLSEFRKQELERYKSKSIFNAEQYLSIHPAAIVPQVRSQTILGEADCVMTKREAENPNRKIVFKPSKKKE